MAGTNQVIIKTVTLELDQREKLNQAMADNFGVDESKITAENISSTVSNEMRQDAVVAVIVATIFMLLYIWFRFKDIRFATSAVTALLHDVFGRACILCGCKNISGQYIYRLYADHRGIFHQCDDRHI